jgi:hypothetical protein
MTKNYFDFSGLRQRDELEMQLTRRTTVSHATIDDDPIEPLIEERITLPQSNKDDIVFVLEKLRFSDDSVELRLGYWVIGRQGGRKDKWSWGESAPFIPPQDLEKIVKIAKEKGMI